MDLELGADLLQSRYPICDQTPQLSMGDQMSGCSLPAYDPLKELAAVLSTPLPDPTKLLELVSKLPRVEIYDELRSSERRPGERSQDRMHDLFLMDARIYEGQTIWEHTLRVLDQYMKYFSGALVPQPLDHGSVLLKLCLHDCGKGIPRSKNDQHDSTVAVTDWLFQN